MPSALENAVAAFDRALARREQVAVAQMLRVWGQAWQRVRAQSEALAHRLAAGEVNQVGLMHRQEMLDDYARQVETEIRALIAVAEPATLALQSEAVAAALRDAPDLVGLAAGPDRAEVMALMRRPDRAAVQALVGAAGDGSPLRSLLEGIAEGRGQAMAERLAAGVAQGQAPGVVARALRSVFAVPAYRATLIARSETQRAYRTATLETYRANDDIVEGWLWVSACDRRSCPACFAMHGTFHRLTAALPEPPGGRCKAVPALRNRPRPALSSGEERLRALPVELQRKVLGAGRYEAWRDGAFSFEQMAGRVRSRDWGTSIRVRPLTELVNVVSNTETAAR